MGTHAGARGGREVNGGATRGDTEVTRWELGGTGGAPRGGSPRGPGGDMGGSQKGHAGDTGGDIGGDAEGDTGGTWGDTGVARGGHGR